MRISEKAAQIPASGIRKMFQIAAHYPDVVNLCIGEPGFPTPSHIVEAGCRALRDGFTKYTPNAGLLPLREAIAEKLERDNHIRTDPETELIVTTGSGEAILLALLAAVNPGEEVILIEPCWPNYYGHITLAGARTVTVPARGENGFIPETEQIEQALSSKTRAILINSPSNPTGAVIPGKLLRQICDLVRKHDLVLISDEPYEKFYYGQTAPESPASFEGMKDFCITINSLSKTYAMTGWRVGYAAGPAHMISSMVKLQESVSSCVNAAAQTASAEALKGPQDSVLFMRKEYQKRGELMVDGLNRCHGIQCRMPDGAFYAFADIRGLGLSSQEAAELLIRKTRVIATPGSAFGPAGEGYLRFSFASPEEEIREALRRMHDFFR
ncbi:MAG: pyridoxal phosphate-dependent aminotransferase [Lachnospiraceae bacterium]|nr:pyridoxal phosphate-dependent aminotransferase [Lachnospiraceae bacterium]